MPADTRNVDKQVSQLSNLIVQKVKAILMDPANPDSFNGVVRQAKAAKIPVVGAGSPIVASDVEADGAASSSHCSIGHELAKGAKILLPNGGTIAILAGPPGAFWAIRSSALLQGGHRRQQYQDRRRADQRAGCRRRALARQRHAAALSERRPALWC